MEYTIVTSNPSKLRREILDCVKNGQDSNGNNINTWENHVVKFRDGKGNVFSEEVLVHDVDAWRDVGYIRLIPDEDGNSRLYARFSYWNEYPTKDRDGSHELYLSGRLSELMLVHFMSGIKAVHIVK